MSETSLASSSQDGEMRRSESADGETMPETGLSTTPAIQTASPLSDTDYDAIADAVMETERGRWFLKEYARRNRHADTQTVLDALDRLGDRIDTAAKSDDTSVALISHNVIDLAEAITQVKREVQELGGSDDKDHFNSATEELEAIVSQTEAATGEILEAAEKIQEVLWTLREEGANETQCDIIETKIIDVYTACSFQDLTGQRSSKVVRLVGYVEKRVSAMMEILGLSARSLEDAAATEDASLSAAEPNDDASTLSEAYQEGDTRSDAHLLHGPALEGDGIEQDDVDALFGGKAVEGDDGVDLDDRAGSEDNMVLEAQDQEDQGNNQLEEGNSDEAGPEHEMAAAEEPQPLDDDLDEVATFDDPAASDDTEPELSDADKDLARLDTEAAADADDQITDGDDPSAGIITDDMVVEIHDAEILRRPAEDALIDDALAQSSTPPDIFDVETVDFDGPDMGQRVHRGDDDHADLDYQSSRDPQKLLVDMPDDFAVDAGTADMFDDGAETPTNLDNGASDAGAAKSSADAAQDIFDVDDFGIEDLAGDTDADPQSTPGEDSSIDDTLEPEAAGDADEDALDHALNALQVNSADQEDANQASNPTAANEDEPVPYTDEERIALFS